ncbi:MAG: T9SS type A sorting domain-containing protein [Hymenobacter sp.]
MLVYFTSTAPGGVPAVIGAAFANFAPSSSYTALTLPIQYISSSLPDSVHIQIGSGDAAKLTPGAKLLVDDITFSGTALAVRADAGLQAQFTVSPNPSPSGRFVISSPATPELAAAPLTVLDVLGREVLRQPAQAAPTPQRTLDLGHLALGIYLLRLDSKQGVITRQLVVK